jgi:SAM-dependent methyltransferase
MPNIKESLDRLVNLGGNKEDEIHVNCKVCGYVAPLFDVVDFNKFCNFQNAYEYGLSGITVPYYRCNKCEFLFTTLFDKWTVDDFSKYIYNKEYIIVDPQYILERPKQCASYVAASLKEECRSAEILDYGCGNGTFVNLLKEYGYSNVTGYDPVSSPKRPTGRFTVLFSFEVIEHSPTPLETFEDVFSLMGEGGCCIFSQSLQPEDINTIRGSWWYIAPRNGHVSTYSKKTLAFIAEKYDVDFYEISPTVYAFARRELSSLAEAALLGFGCHGKRTYYIEPNSIYSYDSKILIFHGFSGPEHGFRWTSNKKSQIVFNCAEDLKNQIISINLAQINGYQQDARILLNDVEIKKCFINNSKKKIIFAIDKIDSGKNTITLELPMAHVPGNPDKRMLGIAIESINFSDRSNVDFSNALELIDNCNFSTADVVRTLYRAALGRDADKNGLVHYVSYLNTNKDKLYKLADHFYSTKEL